MNEFVVILKWIDLKNGKLKYWKFENFQIQWLYKKSLTLVVIFFQIHLRNSQKNETEPTRWLQSKDPWKSEWNRHFN